MIVGIAYHSPLDVVALFPIEIKYSLFPDDEVDVLISDNVIRIFKARVQLVFTSARNLVKENLPIIDQGSWGKVISLDSTQMEELLKKREYSFVPDWVNYKR